MHSNKQASDHDDSVMLTILFFKMQGLYSTLFKIYTSLNFNITLFMSKQ